MRHRRMRGREREAETEGKGELPAGLRPLSDLPAGRRGIVRQLRGGGQFTARVAGMGIALGAEVKVAQNYADGPVLVEVRDTRLALGRGEAVKILVEAEAEA